MKHLNCPKCSRDFVNRVSRSDRFERLLSTFYVYPFRCQVCGHRFKRFQFGVVYRKVDSDRREFERLQVHFPVSIYGENGEQSQGVLHNLSMRGCAMTTVEECEAQTVLRLEVQVPNVRRPIVVEAAAVRSARADHTGLEFLRLDDAERQRLRVLIQGLLAARHTEVEDQAFSIAWGAESAGDHGA